MKWRNLFSSRLLLVVLAVLVIAAISLVLYDPFDFDDRPHIERLLKLAVNNVQADVAADMEARILAQAQIAQLWKLGGISAREWEATANLFLAHHPGYIRLQLLDKTYRKEQTAALPTEANLANAVDILSDRRLRDILQMPMTSTNQQARTAAITLQDGDIGRSQL
jgi:sensor domain CHASE-containing protein